MSLEDFFKPIFNPKSLLKVLLLGFAGGGIFTLTSNYVSAWRDVDALFIQAGGKTNSTLSVHRKADYVSERLKYFSTNSPANYSEKR